MNSVIEAGNGVRVGRWDALRRATADWALHLDSKNLGLIMTYIICMLAKRLRLFHFLHAH